MYFKVSSTALMSRLANASKVMASKNAMSILDSFLLEVNEGELKVTASDSEKRMITTVPVLEQDGTMSFCVQAKTLMDSLREIPEQPIILDINPNTYELHGKHSSGQFTIMAQESSTYPESRPATDGKELEIPSNIILNGITRCIFATANDEVRLVMNGIYCDLKEDHIIFVGTDGRKLVRNTIRNITPNTEGGFILPKKVATILKNVLPKDDTPITVRFANDRATIETADMTMHFRLIDGNYPNYNAVIPQYNPYRATIDRQALGSALKRVSVFCNQSSGLVRLELTQNQLRLTGQDTEYSTSGEEYLNCDYNNNNIAIGFSCPFLIEICNILESENVILELADPSRPGIVLPADESDADELLMLLMPMRVED